MENTKYKLYAKTNKDNLIIDIKTDAFINDIKDWQEIGEQDSRHYHEPLANNEGVYLYKLVGKVKTDRKSKDVATETEKIIVTNEKTQTKELLIKNKIRSQSIKELQKDNKLDNKENII